MNMKNVLKSAIAILLLPINGLAETPAPITIGDVEMKNDAKSAAFQKVLKKIGKWEGRMTQGLTGKVFDVSYQYKLTSGGNTITETIIEDGVEMLTTYSDKDGELIVKHYCALGTEPVFTVSKASEKVVTIELDKSRSELHAVHDSFVTGMTWTMTSSNSMTFENTVLLDGELTRNKAELRRVN